MAALILGAADGIKNQFAFKEVDSTNLVFKMFAKVSFGLCLLSSILVMMSEYIGEPIKCEHGTDKIDEGLFTTYCWIHGSKKIHEDYQEHFECKANTTDESTKDTIYYQWVVFMLAINGIMFKIPHLLWRVCEGGIMKEFHRGKNAKSKLMEDDTMRSNLKIHMHSFKKLKGQKNLGYYTRFQICQVLNLLMLILIWWSTNQFLSGHFHTYGVEVTEFYSKEAFVRGKTHDPMCNAFPTVVGCTMPVVDVAGTGVPVTGICILAQNIINEKVYLFLWFWFVFLFVMVSAQLLFEIAVVAIPAFRIWVTAQQTGTYTGQMKSYLQFHCNVGDWFLLYQIGKNTNKDFFYNLIDKLSLEDQNPKGNGDIEKLLGDEADNETLELDERK